MSDENADKPISENKIPPAGLVATPVTKTSIEKVSPSPSKDNGQDEKIPAGYRQGIVTAITIFITFSLAFFRFWAFDAEGKWTCYSIAVAVLISGAIVLQIYTLFRALRLADDIPKEYTKTVRLFLISTVILIIAVLFASVVIAGAFKDKSEENGPKNPLAGEVNGTGINQ